MLMPDTHLKNAAVGVCQRGNRKTQEHFKCAKCGYENNADLNAALNITNNFRASVNKPIVAGSNA